MEGQGVWPGYLLLIFLAKYVSGFGIEQSFTIYMDVGNDIENVINWGNTCEKKQINMEGILQRNIWDMKESERKLNEKISNSNSKIENLENLVGVYKEKLTMLENSLESISSEFKKKEGEFENTILKLSSAVDSLSSKIELRSNEKSLPERRRTIPEKQASGNLPAAPSTNVSEKGQLAEQACDSIERLKPSNLPIENYHYMASIGLKIVNSYRSRCMGAFIDKRFVIATAQCLSKVKVNAVRLGYASTVTSEQMDMVVNPIKKVHIHPKYSRNSRVNSYVALVELEDEVGYSALRFPICLYTSASIPLSNADIYFAYWDISSNLILGQMRARLVPYEHCLRLGENSISPDVMCTQNDNDTQGDMYTVSNGPIVLMGNGIKKVHRLIAVDSKSENRNGLYFSHKITNIYDNLDFIESIVWKG